jgi:hypothetical protein
MARSLRQRSLEVLEDLVRARPLARLDNEVDVAVSVPIQGMISDTRRVDAERPQLVPPGHRGDLIFEGADGLPSVKPRIADGNRRILRGPAQAANGRMERAARPAPI